MRMTIRLKLGLTFFAVIALSALSAGLGITSLGSLDATLRDTIEGPVERVHTAQSMLVDYLLLVRSDKELLLATSADDRTGFDAKATKAKADIATDLDRGLSLSSTEGKTRWNAFKVTLDQFLRADDHLRQFARAGDIAKATQVSTEEMRGLVTQAEQEVRAVIAAQEAELMQAKESAVAQYQSARMWLMASTIAAIAISVAAGLWISFSIATGLGRARNLAMAVAEGDLTQTVDNKSNDEIGDLIGHVNAMVLRLREVVGEALSAADNVSSGSQQLSASAEQLSQGATEQASSAEEASASMEEMAANIKQNADNAAQTEKIARQSATDAQMGGEAVARAVTAMQTIAEKITIVQEIARQTDLLALNAAV
jgi:methyl-accepting chemotaxis protein